MIKLFSIIILLFSYPCFAQTLSGGVLSGSGLSKALSCESTASGPKQETQDTGVTNDNDRESQKLKITSSITVCKVDVFFGTGESGTCKIQFWSDINRSGTQYGGDSSTVTCSGWPTAFTWSSNMPVLTTDVFMHIVNVSGTQNSIGLNNSADSYENTDYDFYRGGDDYNKDLVFRVYKYY